MTNFIGIKKDLSNAEYHSMKQYISRSSLMDFSRTPHQYWAKHLSESRIKDSPSPAMILGSAFHMYVLEPHLFYEEYIIKPEHVLLRDVGREAYDSYKLLAIECEKSNKTVLTAEQYNLIKAMKERFDASEHISEILHGGRVEQSFFWQDSNSGMFLKCRPDLLHSNMIVDIKTSSNLSEKAMQREVFASGYDIQMAMIQDAVIAIEDNQIDNFILVCIETKYPFNTAIYLLDIEIIENAKKKYKNLLLDLKACIEINSFPDYGINQIHLPSWEIFN